MVQLRGVTCGLVAVHLPGALSVRGSLQGHAATGGRLQEEDGSQGR